MTGSIFVIYGLLILFIPSSGGTVRDMKFRSHPQLSNYIANNSITMKNVFDNGLCGLECSKHQQCHSFVFVEPTSECLLYQEEWLGDSLHNYTSGAKYFIPMTYQIVSNIAESTTTEVTTVGTTEDTTMGNISEAQSTTQFLIGRR